MASGATGGGDEPPGRKPAPWQAAYWLEEVGERSVAAFAWSWGEATEPSAKTMRLKVT